MIGVDDLIGGAFKLIGDIVDGDNRRKVAINESNNNAIVKGLGMILTASVTAYGIKKFSESDSKQKLLK